MRIWKGWERKKGRDPGSLSVLKLVEGGPQLTPLETKAQTKQAMVPSSAMKFSRKTLSEVGLAILLAASFALFAYGYWLADILPSGSRRLPVTVLLIWAAASVGYFFLLGWIRSRLKRLTRIPRWQIACLSLLIGIFLFLSGTTDWQKHDKYLQAFLPHHTLEIYTTEERSPRSLAVTWIYTSLEDVPESNIEFRGWAEAEDTLVLETPADNSFFWSGQAGDYIEVVFQARGAGEAIVACDGVTETLLLSTGQVRYSCKFAVPWYGSRGAVLSLGLLNFAALSSGLVLLIQEKYPVLAKQWMESRPDKTKWQRGEVLFLAIAFAIALLLRVPNLENPYPAVDEYYHLIAARQINEGAPLSDVYERSLLLVTLPVAFSLRVFGNEIWAARLVGALFNVLAIIPLYALSRKINRPVALLSVGLFVISPWIITFARIVREYAYYPFYFYLIALGMVTFNEVFPERFAISRDWKKLLTPRVGLLGSALIFPVIFPLVDPNSTFKLIWLSYFVLAALILNKCDLRDWGNRLALFLIALVPVLILASGRGLNRAWLGITFNPHPLSYFFSNPPQQWYYDRLSFIAGVSFLLAILFSWIIRRRTVVPFFILSLFFTFLLGFIFFFQTERHFRTRHLLTANLWYVILFATGVYALWNIFLALFRSNRASREIVAAVLIGLALLNIPQSFLPVLGKEGISLISEDDYFDMGPAHEFMQKSARPEDILLATSYNLYATWRQEPPFRSIFRLPRDLDSLAALVESNNSGWIVIDLPRLDLMSGPIRDYLSNPNVEYIGLLGDQHVWHWESSSAN